jgi:hypothetical protein
MLADEFGVTEDHGAAHDLDGPHTSSHMKGVWQKMIVLRSLEQGRWMEGH